MAPLLESNQVATCPQKRALDDHATGLPSKKPRTDDSLQEPSAKAAFGPTPPATSWWGLRLPTRATLLRWLCRNNSAPTPTKSFVGVSFTGSVAHQELNGRYQNVGDEFAADLEHSFPTFFNSESKIYCYFWYDEADKASTGWYFGDVVACDDILGFCPSESSSVPPGDGWQIAQVDGSMAVEMSFRRAD